MEKLKEQLFSISVDSEKLQLLQDAAKYLSVQSQGTGKEFWRDFMLSASKDYTNGMQFYQAITELKTRMYRLVDDSTTLQKEQCELELLELDVQELELNTLGSDLDKKRNDIRLRQKSLELKQKRVRIESMNIALNELYKEIQDFNELANEYLAVGVPEFKEARYLDMQKKAEDRYLNHLLTGIPLSNSELSFYYKDGLLVPPVNIPNRILALAQADGGKDIGLLQLAEHEQAKIDAAAKVIGSAPQIQYQSTLQLENKK